MRIIDGIIGRAKANICLKTIGKLLMIFRACSSNQLGEVNRKQRQLALFVGVRLI
jgi:hypothetical protein